MIQVQDTTTFLAWGFESSRVYCQGIKKSAGCKSPNCSWVSSNTFPQKKRKGFFISPSWITHLKTEVDAPPHTWNLSKSFWQRMFSCTFCSSIHMCYWRRINPWQGIHGLASASLVTNAQLKSANLPVPQFFSHPWNSKRTSVFHRAAVMVVKLMLLKHSDASTHAKMQVESVSQWNTGLCPRGGCSLMAGPTDNLWCALGRFEMSAKPQRVPKKRMGK